MHKNQAIQEHVANPERGEAARLKLIKAGLKIFSDVGYEAASTRSLAAEAGVNIAAIPYYFRSKEGLYHAVIDHIIAYYRGGIDSSLGKVKEALRDKKKTPADYRALFGDYIHSYIHFVLQEGSERAQMSHIYIREQLDPSSAFQRLYEGFVRDNHETMAALVGRIVSAHISSADMKLLTQTLIGQIAVFKLSRQSILHNMGWKHYGKEEMAAIERIIMSNFDILLAAYQKKGSLP